MKFSLHQSIAAMVGHMKQRFFDDAWDRAVEKAGGEVALEKLFKQNSAHSVAAQSEIVRELAETGKVRPRNWKPKNAASELCYVKTRKMFENQFGLQAALRIIREHKGAYMNDHNILFSRELIKAGKGLSAEDRKAMTAAAACKTRKELGRIITECSPTGKASTVAEVKIFKVGKDGAAMTRADLNKLSPEDRADFLKHGGTVVEAPPISTTPRPAAAKQPESRVARTLSRSEFVKLSSAEKSDFCRTGGKVVDDPPSSAPAPPRPTRAPAEKPRATATRGEFTLWTARRKSEHIRNGGKIVD